MSMAIVCYGTVYRHTINTNNIYLLTVLSTSFKLLVMRGLITKRMAPYLVHCGLARGGRVCILTFLLFTLNEGPRPYSQNPKPESQSETVSKAEKATVSVGVRVSWKLVRFRARDWRLVNACDW